MEFASRVEGKKIQQQINDLSNVKNRELKEIEELDRKMGKCKDKLEELK